MITAVATEMAMAVHVATIAIIMLLRDEMAMEIETEETRAI